MNYRNHGVNLVKKDDGVFQCLDNIVSLSDKEIEFLRQQADLSTKKRARICAHTDNNDLLHEMIIVLSKDTYIHPHKHTNKSESFHVIEGDADVVILSDEGKIESVISLSAGSSDKAFFYRLNNNKFHTLLIRSDYLIMHEVTNGPFSRNSTELAKFAPDEKNILDARKYLEDIDCQIRQPNLY